MFRYQKVPKITKQPVDLIHISTKQSTYQSLFIHQNACKLNEISHSRKMYYKSHYAIQSTKKRFVYSCKQKNVNFINNFQTLQGEKVGISAGEMVETNVSTSGSP